MKFAIILGNLGNTCDRFLSSGYKDQPSKEEMVKQAAEIEGVNGIELVGSWDVAEDNVDEVGDLLGKYNLECVSIIPDHFSQKRWGKGTFSSKDPMVREQAVEETCKAAEIARKLNCQLINIWPGQDGYDYPLQSDYREERQWMKENLYTVCTRYPDIQFALEYKMKEPRTHCFLARCADTLLMAKEINRPNVGITVDVGHSLLAYENVAEAVVMLKIYGDRLFHLHFNDNYRSWDDDMIVGSVHFVEYVELLFWLKEIGYSGWYSMDLYPYREDAKGALRESIEFIKGVNTILTPEAMNELREIIKKGDATKSTAWVREMIFR
jgi:sugar phosphate isomerase/epimerase